MGHIDPEEYLYSHLLTTCTLPLLLSHFSRIYIPQFPITRQFKFIGSPILSRGKTDALMLFFEEKVVAILSESIPKNPLGMSSLDTFSKFDCMCVLYPIICLSSLYTNAVLCPISKRTSGVAICVDLAIPETLLLSSFPGLPQPFFLPNHYRLYQLWFKDGFICRHRYRAPQCFP